jgi:phage tail sheath protein FI
MPSYLSPGVYVEAVPPASRPIEGVSTSVAAFVGFAETGPVNEPVLVTNWSQFTGAFGGFLPKGYLAHAVYGWFHNGGTRAYVVRLPEAAPALAALESSASADLRSAADPALAGLRVRALEPGEAGTQITVAVEEVAEPGEGSAPGEVFRLVVRRGATEEVFDAVTTRRGRQNVLTVVNAASQLVRLEELPAPAGLDRRPATTSEPVALQAPPTVSVPAQRVSADAYVGDSGDRTGFAGLEALDDVTMVLCPDAVAAYEQGLLDMDGLKAVQLGIIAHCELLGDRMAVLDTPPGLTAQQAAHWRTEIAGYDSKFAALYWPWVCVQDPVAGGVRPVPPSGHVAGLWARTDAERGVHKAPANDVLRGVLDVELQTTRGEHDGLNPIGVNVIRKFAGRGVRVFGARTLSSDPQWRYISTRRLFNYVQSSLVNGTQWVVFEPNDRALWGQVTRTVSAFVSTVWRAGALFGDTPAEAYYVKCDDETNPSESIEAGQLVVEIGIAPVKPAEFVVFRLAQMPSGVSAVAE